jgi:hypothetical protein
VEEALETTKTMKTGNWKTLTFALLALAVSAVHGRAQSTHTLYAFTSFAGKPGGAGNVDGIGSAARFFLTGFGPASTDGTGSDARAGIHESVGIRRRRQRRKKCLTVEMARRKISKVNPDEKQFFRDRAG